jgi:phosphohistidine phosphatase
MELYLLRHGIAANAQEPAPDGERPLTDKGRKRMRKAARGLRRLGIDCDAILTSPLVRARQTADIVAAALGQEARLSVLDALQPNSSTDELLASLHDHEHCGSLMLVGHEPLLSQLASVLLTAKKNAALDINLKKGGLCCIEVDDLPPRNPGILRFLLAPKHLRLLGARG